MNLLLPPSGKRCVALCDGTIGNLLRSRCPSAISRLVVAVVVLALDGVGFARTLAHVGEKRLEALPPAFANRDPATTVPVEPFVLRVCAPSDHGAPTIVLGRRLSVDRVSVRCRAIACGFDGQAPTTACGALFVPQFAAVDHFRPAARTSAEPKVSRPLPSMKRDHGQTAKRLTDEVGHPSFPGCWHRKFPLKQAMNKTNGGNLQ